MCVFHLRNSLMGILFLILGAVLLLAYALQERALLTQAEAGQLEQEDKEQALALPHNLEVDVLAARLGIVCGAWLLAYGWICIANPWYHTLRADWMLSRLVAATMLLVTPIGLLATLIWWLGYLLGEHNYQFMGKRPWMAAHLWPMRILALPLNKLTLRASREPVDAGELLLSLSGSPDAFWQMVQDEDGRDVAVVNRQIFDKAAELRSIRVRECMTFRTDIAAIEEQEGIEGLRKAFLATGYSKIPVYKEDLDHVVGYCHCSALFRKPKHIEDILSDVLTVPESMTASQLLVEMNQAQKSMAIVIDEYGGTSGVVTMEDVMEEIFGEIEDELDEQTETEQQEDDNTWLLSARLEVDYLNEKYGWDLPTGDYESLGGLVVHLHQDLPEQGQIIETPPFRFEVIGMEETRVTLIRLSYDA